MELPIASIHNETYSVIGNQEQEENIRILDIDDTYLVSVILIDKFTKKFIKITETAFTSIEEAEDFLRRDLNIDLPKEVKESDEPDWRDYEYD